MQLCAACATATLGSASVVASADLVGQLLRGNAVVIGGHSYTASEEEDAAFTASRVPLSVPC